jgi:hypothetical protein
MPFMQSEAAGWKLRELGDAAAVLLPPYLELGDMVLWDNTGTMHRALPYDHKSGALMHPHQAGRRGSLRLIELANAPLTLSGPNHGRLPRVEG